MTKSLTALPPAHGSCPSDPSKVQSAAPSSSPSARDGRTPRSRRYLSPPQVAQLLAVAPDKIRKWIEAGELDAIDVSEGRRPLWRISPEALARFERRRSNCARASPAPTPPRRRPTDITRYV